MNTAKAGRWINHPVVAGIVGVFAGGLAIAAIEWLGHQWLGPAQPGAAATISDAMFGAVLVAWVVGAWTAGTVATLWAGRRTALPGAIGGLVLLAGSVATMFAFPHPVWVIAGALLLMPAAAWFGARARLAA
jgi:hypothetical protein